MRASRSLPETLQIRVAVTGRVSLHVHKLGQSQKYALLAEEHGPVTGTLHQNGWMLVLHPTKDIGMVGLPVEGGMSWQRAFNEGLIDIEIRTQCHEPWQQIEEWDDLPFVNAGS